MNSYEPSEGAKRDISKRFRLGLGLSAALVAGVLAYDYGFSGKPEPQKTHQELRVPVQDPKNLEDKVASAPVNNLELVRQGKLDARIYLESIIEHMPEYQQARKDGVIKGWKYNASEKDIQSLDEEILGSHFSSKDIEEVVKKDITHYPRVSVEHPVSLFPYTSKTLGMHVPRYIIFNPSLFSSKDLDCDEDIVSSTKGFISLSKDSYNGLTLSDMVVNQQTLEHKEVSELFFGYLMNLRAHNFKLMDVGNAYSVNKKLPVSPIYLYGISESYSTLLAATEGSISNDFEKKLFASQLKNFNSLIVEKNEDTDTFNININRAEGNFSIPVDKKQGKNRLEPFNF